MKRADERVLKKDRRKRPFYEAAVLAGGQSRRMGQEKALLELEGQPLLERSLTLLGNRFERLLVSVPPEGPSEGVAQIAATVRGRGRRVDVVPDRRPERQGPLAAIESILEALEGPGVFVVAVDVPILHDALIDALCRQAEVAECYAAVPRWRRGLEPLYAVYRRALLPAVSKLLDGGELRPQALTAEPGVVSFEVRAPEESDGYQETFVADRDPALIFRNLNEPGDYKEFRGDS